jgi:hypothetical protein
MLVVLSPLAYNNPPGSVSTSLSDSSVSVSLILACGGITPCVYFLFPFLRSRISKIFGHWHAVYITHDNMQIRIRYI